MLQRLFLLLSIPIKAVKTIWCLKAWHNTFLPNITSTVGYQMIVWKKFTQSNYVTVLFPVNHVKPHKCYIVITRWLHLKNAWLQFNRCTHVPPARVFLTSNPATDTVSISWRDVWRIITRLTNCGINISVRICFNPTVLQSLVLQSNVLLITCSLFYLIDSDLNY